MPGGAPAAACRSRGGGARNGLRLGTLPVAWNCKNKETEAVHSGGGARGVGRPSIVAASPGTSVPAVQIASERCLSVQRPGIPCDACAANCPTDAVGLAERSLTIALDRCSGCGRCAAACPTEALAIDGFAAIPATVSRLECARVPAELRGPATESLPCLGGLTAAALRARLGSGEHSLLTLVDRGWCADCPAGRTAEPWQGVLARVSRELADIGVTRRVEVVREPLPAGVAGSPPALPARHEPALGRRELLRATVALRPGSGPKRLTAQGAGPPRRVDATTLRERAGRLRALAAGRDLPASLFPNLVIAATCCDRRLCAASCPTSALQMEVDEERSILHFDPLLCAGCRLCVEVCPTGSLVMLPLGEPGPVERKILRQRSLVRCERCGANYGPPSEGGRCSTCETDQDLSVFVHRWVRGRSAAPEV